MKKFLLACFSGIIFTISSCGPSQIEVESKNAINDAISNGKQLFIISPGISINSVGGVSPRLEFYNLSNKMVKYVVFDITPYNAVGDVQRSEIGGDSTVQLRAVGPISSMQSGVYSWDNAWYNDTISCIVVNRVSVEYMDRSTHTISGAGSVLEVMQPIPPGWIVASTFNEGHRNSCKI